MEGVVGVENEVAGRGPLQASVRGLLVVALVVAVLITALTVLTGVLGIVRDLTSGTLSTSLLTDAPAPGGADVVTAVYATAAVVVRRAAASTTALVLGASGAGLLARLAVGAALVVMLLAVRRRAPFSRAVAMQVTVAGGLAAILAVLQIGAGVLGDWMLADQLDPSGSGRWPTEAGFDPTLLAIGFGLMVVGLLLAHGAELQRETDGLV